MAAVWGIVVAILLELVCYAGSGATARLLHEAVRSPVEVRGEVAETLREKAREGLGQTATPRDAGSRTIDHRRRSMLAWLGKGNGDDATGQGAGPDPAKVQADFVAQARHADVVAGFVADARAGLLDDCSFPYLRDQRGLTNSQAEQVRKALLEEELAIMAPGNRVVMV